jgi:hypothetical protein
VEIYGESVQSQPKEEKEFICLVIVTEMFGEKVFEAMSKNGIYSHVWLL